MIVLLSWTIASSKILNRKKDEAYWMIKAFNLILKHWT